MKSLALISLLAMLALPLPLAAQTPPPVEAFGRLPAVADAAISADGRRVALATSRADGQASIVIVNLDQPNERSAYSVGENMQLRGIAWADSERVAYLVSQTFHPGAVLPPNRSFRGRPRRVDYFRWGTINTTTGRALTLTTNEENTWADQGSSLISPVEGDPGYGRMIGRNADVNRLGLALFRVNLDTSRVTEIDIAGANRDTYDFVVDRAGAAVARLDADPATNTRRLYVYDGNTPRLLLQDVSRFGEPFSIAGLLPDGRLVAVDTSDAGFVTAYAIDRTEGNSQVLHEVDGADIDRALTDPWTHDVVGVGWTAVETEEHYFDPALQRVRDAIVAAGQFSGFSLVTWSQDRSRFIVYGERGLDGGAYYLFDPNASSMRFLSARYPDLRDVRLGERQSITYRARDGTRIPAYLTLPHGVEAHGLPLILLVHGGPHSRDEMSFDWWATFLVSRGYAVLQPNFRGSSGYGEAWEEAGRRQWGGLMQTDVEDGVAALVRAGIADEGRVCIVGGSYGGYAALAGVTLTPERYNCAVAVAGVSDLPLMLTQVERQSGGGDSLRADWWRASIGDRQEDREHIRSVSPVFLAERVQAPVLLIHGTDDTVVPIDHSRRMLRALEGAGKNVRFVELRGDDHWLSDAPTRIQMLRETETFLAQHLRAPN